MKIKKRNLSILLQALPYIRILVAVPISTVVFNALTDFVVAQPYNRIFILKYGLWSWDIIMTVAAFIIYTGVSYLLAPVPVKRIAVFAGFVYYGLQDSVLKVAFLLPSVSIEAAIKTQIIAGWLLWLGIFSFVIIKYIAGLRVP